MSRIAWHCTMLALMLVLSGGCVDEQSAPPMSAELPEELPEFTNSIGMKFNLIPAGEFMMGEVAGAQQKVQITEPFYFGVTEVTQEQYATVMEENPSWFSGTGLGADEVKGLDTSSFPVERVSWEDAVEFCQKLSTEESRQYRLPTEAEWEYACRAGTTTKWCFGDDAARLEEYGWYRDNADERTHTVAQKKPNAWGLYDMHGNVWEWCTDWHNPRDYSKSSPSAPRGTSEGPYRVDRGGCWRVAASVCRSAYRGGGLPIARKGYLGFRVAADLPSSQATQKSEAER